MFFTVLRFARRSSADHSNGLPSCLLLQSACYLLITLVVSENTLSTALEISGVAAAINNAIKTSMMAYSIVVTPHSFCLFVNISLPSFLQMSIGANRSRTSSSPVSPLPKQADDSVNGRRRTIRHQLLHEPADPFIQLCPRFWIADQTSLHDHFLNKNSGKRHRLPNSRA